MPRSRIHTEQRLLEAVGQIISEEGVEQVGVNRVAVRAAVPKSLIYRYFGGMNGLMEAFIRQNNPTTLAPLPDLNSLRQATLEQLFSTLCDYIIDDYRLMRQNTQALDLLKVALFSPNDPTNTIINEKERVFRQFIDEVAAIIQTKHGRAFAILVNSSMTMLVLLSQQQKSILEIDLSSEEGWLDIEQAMRNLFRGAYLFTKERLELAKGERVKERKSG